MEISNCKAISDAVCHNKDTRSDRETKHWQFVSLSLLSQLFPTLPFSFTQCNVCHGSAPNPTKARTLVPGASVALPSGISTSLVRKWWMVGLKPEFSYYQGKAKSDILCLSLDFREILPIVEPGAALGMKGLYGRWLIEGCLRREPHVVPG